MPVQYNNTLSWFCQLAVPTVWWLSTKVNCRHKIKVIDIALGWGAVITNEPWHGISNNVVCAISKASDQPAHTRSLIRAFASRLNIL